MALRFEEVQTKRSEKSEDKLSLCFCIYVYWMAIDHLQDRDFWMGQVLVNAMVGLPLLGNIICLPLLITVSPMINSVDDLC